MTACLAWMMSCAQISSTSEVTLVPGAGQARVVGVSGGWELDRSYEASWLQLGNQLVVELREHRACQEILHTPVVRVEKITRRADATLIWEFLVAGGLAGFAVFAFTRPEAFGGRYVDGETGEVVTNTAPGYRTGGIFLGISALLLAAGCYDIARARDEHIYTDAFELRPGAGVECAEPVRAVAQREVTLVVGEHESEASTDDQGRVRLFLPPQRTFENRHGKIVDRRINAAVRVDRNRAVRVDFMVPYDRRLGDTHTGHAEPGPHDRSDDRQPVLERDQEANDDASPGRPR